MACDPNFSNVVLLAHFDGAGTAFVDSSSLANPMTAVGTGTQSGSPAPKFGAASMDTTLTGSFNGVGVPDISGFDPTGDFVIEFFLYLPATSSSNNVLVQRNNFTSIYPYQILVNNGFVSANGADGVGATVYSLGAGVGFQCNYDAWNYIVLQRAGTLFSLYINGALADSGTSGASLGYNLSDLEIGSSNDPLSIDEFRFTNGISRYVGSTIAVPTAPFGVACPVDVPVPDVTGETVVAGSADIIAATLTVAATVLDESSQTIPAGLITRTAPPAGTLVLPGSEVTIFRSTGSGGDEVPSVVGMTPGEAIAYLASLGGEFPLGAQVPESSPTTPKGRITRQAPVAGSFVPLGTPINVFVSTGPAGVVVPDLEGDSASAAALALAAVGLGLGPVSFDNNPAPGQQLGVVEAQTILAGTVVPPGTKVGFTIAQLLAPFDVAQTVISQYANSATILALVHDMAEAIDPRINLENFYQFVWNVDTAVGFGLDIWGRIVDISRLLHIPAGSERPFGFFNADVPLDWENFATRHGPSEGGTFATRGSLTETYLLPDDAYRTLILTKALANIAATNAPSLNKLLQNLFPGRGKAYVQDLGGMAMRFVFEFSLTTVELAILQQSGALPHPAGVSVNIQVTPTPAEGFFGFSEAGDDSQPYGQAPYFS